MKKILIVFGTRPEAIKMAPLVKEFQHKPKEFETKVCVTAQHREMLDQVLDFFKIFPDYDLNLMQPGQNLNQLTARVIDKLEPILNEFSPNYVFVHGDTTTAMSAAIATYYFGAKLCHVEAGLRTFNKYSPFPEELNRQIIGRIADFHFAPTVQSKNNLVKENIDKKNIFVTGNTVIDALFQSVELVNTLSTAEIKELKEIVGDTDKVLLVTGHRRENHGAGFDNICKALKEIALKHKDIKIIFPAHLNPKVLKPVINQLSGIKNIYLIEPLTYPGFIWIMNKSKIIITDSGGVQEEAPSLGKPVLVMRDTTERPEAVEAGTVILVGTDTKSIVENVNILLNDSNIYHEMSRLHNPYGDGLASKRIVEAF